MNSVSIIIPVLNAERELPRLLNALKAQSCPVNEIIVVDSESEDRTVDICRREPMVRLIQIKRSDFDHGGTRDMALRQTDSDIVVFMTQDAIPADENLIEQLIDPLLKADVAVCTGRQIAKSDATPMERLVREFNYPATSHIRSGEDIPRLGIKAFFCSDVCAAYNRAVYLKLGGFEHPIMTNEDMFFAAAALQNGYQIAYEAEARVYHSHNFSLREQYRRNYIQGYEMERHQELLGCVPQVREGIRLVKYVGTALIRQGRIGSLIRFGLDCCARYMGNRAGKRAYRRKKAE